MTIQSHTDPNESLQATVGSAVFEKFSGFAVGLGLSDGFRQIPTAPELGSLGLNK